MSKREEMAEWRWAEAKVDSAGAHLQLYFREDKEPSALVGPAEGNCFPVELLVDQAATDSMVVERQEAVRAELDLYLTDVGRPNPWAYAFYHSGTASNIYSAVHWVAVSGKGD